MRTVRFHFTESDSNGKPTARLGCEEIAGEVGIPGKAIGEIDIHRDHTFVDVSEKHVRQVLRQSSGNYMLRGKPVLLKLAS